MEINTIYNESCLDTLKKMPDNFIDCVITSPPYWQLRDYGYEGQWGLEPTFNEYLEHLWQMMDEIYRALKPEGTCWINLGDTYSAGGRGASGDLSEKQKSNTGTIALANLGVRKAPEGMMNKTLLLLPHRFAIGCSDRSWIIRNDIIWAKRNAMPESVTDRFSKKHEYFFFMTKSEKYFFDLDAIKGKRTSKEIANDFKRIMADKNGGGKKHTQGGTSSFVRTERTDEEVLKNLELGKNPGSVSDFWDIPTQPSSEKHYASYNDALLLKPVLAGCPEDGIIYDPFMGTGSTAEVALRAKRKFIGSEMSKEYLEICNQRLEPFLTQHKLF